MNCLQNRDAELAILGLCMEDQSCAVQVSALPPDIFASRDTQAVHRAVQRIVQKGEKPDIITLIAEVTADIPEPHQLLMECSQAGFAPSMYGQYLGILDECRKRRLMQIQGTELLKAANDPAASPDAVADAAVNAFRCDSAANSSITAAQGLQQLWENIENAKKDRCYTGLADFARMTGGFRGGKLIILGARPGVGKTALALQIATYTATHCAPVLIVSLEMDGAEIMSRIAAARSGVDVQRMETGDFTDDDWSDLARAMPEASRLPMRIATHATTPALIRKEASAMKYSQGLGMIVVDYIQLLHSSQKVTSRYEEVSEISRDLKQLAMDLGVPVLALTQFNRQSESGTGGKAEKRKPQMSESKESGSIEQDANMFLTLWEPAEPSGDNEYAFRTWKACCDLGVAWMALHVDKNRQGRTGYIYLGFDKPHMTFRCIDVRCYA